MQLLARFFALNRRLSFAVEARLPRSFRQHLQTLYQHEVAQLLNCRGAEVVLDVGGGKDCPFLADLDAPAAHLIIALDCSEGQLRRNHHLDNRVVGDAALKRGFPIRDRSVDFVVSRSVVEHISDNRVFFENCARALRPGGTMVHAFPGRFAPFALMNQLLPNWLVRRLIAYLLPHWTEEDNYGFIAFYDHCYYSAIQKLLVDAGFGNPRYILTYYQSQYFISFFPLYCLSVGYDFLNWLTGIRNLASGVLVVAERPSDASDWAEVPAYHSAGQGK